MRYIFSVIHHPYLSIHHRFHTTNLEASRSVGKATARYDFNNNLPKNSDEVFVVLAFSGGGTRAAALSYEC